MEHKIAWTNCNKKYLTERLGKCVFYIRSCHIMKGKKVYNHYILKIWSKKLPPQLPSDASPIWLKPLVHDYQQTYFTNLKKKALVILIKFSIFFGKNSPNFWYHKIDKNTQLRTLLRSSEEDYLRNKYERFSGELFPF